VKLELGKIAAITIKSQNKAKLQKNLTMIISVIFRQLINQGERTAFLKPLLDKDLDEKIG
jgi:competence transcription factor ComK